MNVVAVDANSIAIACYSAGKNLKTTTGIYAGGVFQFFRALKSYIDKFDANRVYLCWDTDTKNSWRHTEYPEYKADRDRSDPTGFWATYKEQITMIQEVLQHLHVINIRANNTEADDLALRVKIIHKNDYLTLVSNDDDWAQLVGPNTQVYRPRAKKDSEKLLHRGNFEKLIGVPPGRLAEAKALSRDSDNIRGVPRLGFVRACIYLNSVDRTQQISFLGKGIVEQIEEFMRTEQYQQNLKLIDLHRGEDIPQPNLSMGAHNPDEILPLFTKYEFRSLTKDWPTWLDSFRKLQSPEDMMSGFIYQT